jgi:hypothetical protein
MKYFRGIRPVKMESAYILHCHKRRLKCFVEFVQDLASIVVTPFITCGLSSALALSLLTTLAFSSSEHMPFIHATYN